MSTKKTQSKTRKQGNRTFVVILGMVLLVGVAAIGYVISKPKTPAVVFDPNTPLPAPQGQVTGNAEAPVEIVEFGDFECPQCGRFATITEPDVRRLIINTGLARFRFIDFPLPGHPSTLFAHNAAACAAVQGKFWDMHDRIFYGQTEWSELVNGRDMNPAKVMKRYAKEIGLDAKTFGDCLDGRQQEAQVRANYKEGERLGVNQTPTFFVGKRQILGAQAYDLVKAVVDSAIADAKKAPAEKAPGDTSKKAATVKKG